MLDDILATELEYGERVIWRREFAKRNLVPIAEYELIKIQQGASGLDAAFRSELTGEVRVLNASQVIVERGTLPFNDVFDTLRNNASNNGMTDLDALIGGKPQADSGEGYSLFRIGDAVSSRNLAAAMYDALRLCSVI